MQVLSRKLLDSALGRLNARLAYLGRESLEIVVCGGAAMIVFNLISRPTRDVDILEILQPKLEDTDEPQLPSEIRGLVAEIGREFDIKDDWLNFGPARLLRLGVPPGLLKRATCVRYGEFLTVHFIDRLDQVAFKIFAAMDSKEGLRHLADLLELEPTESETRHAVKWLLLDRKTSTEFQDKLRQVLDRLGHEGIAETI
jgi:hypothetical protein